MSCDGGTPYPNLGNICTLFPARTPTRSGGAPGANNLMGPSYLSTVVLLERCFEYIDTSFEPNLWTFMKSIHTFVIGRNNIRFSKKNSRVT